MSSVLEIRHLRTLRAIHETGSLAGAARLISLTQSALSHQLKQLEAHYGKTLFTRDTRPMTLTDTGRELLQLANDILPKIDAAETALTESITPAERFHVAIECHSCFDWLLPALSQVRNHWPSLDVDAQMAFDALPLLKRGQIDVVISSDPVDDPAIEFLELFQYQAQLIVPHDHKLANKKIIQPTDLIKETLVTYPVEVERLDVYKAFLQPAGLEIENRRTSELTDMVIQHVQAGRGIAVLPDWVLQQSPLVKALTVRPLGKHGITRTVYAAVRQDEINNPEVKHFVDATPRIIENLKRH